MRVPNDVTPLSYTMDEEQRRLLIDWSDGHASVHSLRGVAARLPLRVVRGRGRPEGQRGRETRSLPSSRRPSTSLQPVGRYGLTPVWGDGHHTGIYTYERLRAHLPVRRVPRSAGAAVVAPERRGMLRTLRRTASADDTRREPGSRASM